MVTYEQEENRIFVWLDEQGDLEYNEEIRQELEYNLWEQREKCVKDSNTAQEKTK